MNKLDKIITQLENLSAQEILDQLGAEMYQEDFPKREELSLYPQFLQDVIFIIDWDTELTMEGIGGVLENSIHHFIPQIISGLHRMGADNQAEVLSEINTKYQINPDDETIAFLTQKLYLYTDFDIWILVENYLECEKQIFLDNKKQSNER